MEMGAEHQPDATEERNLRALVCEAIADAAVTGCSTVMFGHYQVRAVRQLLPLDGRGSVRVEFKISDQQQVLESGVVNLQHPGARMV